jgi:transposase-like protein
MRKLTYDAVCKIAHDEDKSREMLESLIWGDTPVCPHCGSLKSYKLTPKPDSVRPVRKGTIKCADCRKYYTITTKTIFERTHIPLGTWLQAIVLISSSKKGISAHQIHRMMGIGYKAAWFMLHRIRYAMDGSASFGKLKGIVEADEDYIGGVRKGGMGRLTKDTNKIAIMALVERGGEARVFPIENTTAKTLQGIIRENVKKDSLVMTDKSTSYAYLSNDFTYAHKSVNHSDGEYARGIVSTNTVEGYFSLFKRGVLGVYHHVSKEHIIRYLGEFCFRYNSRKITDAERAILAIKGFEGKRLLYKRPE